MSDVIDKSQADEWASRINACWLKSVEAILQTGRLLIEAKGALAHGEWTPMLESRLLFTPGVAQRLMKIARDGRIAEAAAVGALPPAWSTLSQLSRLDDETFAAALDDGTINPNMEQSAAVRLRRGMHLGAAAAAERDDVARLAFGQLRAEALKALARAELLIAIRAAGQPMSSAANIGSVFTPAELTRLRAEAQASGGAAVNEIDIIPPGAPVPDPTDRAGFAHAINRVLDRSIDALLEAGRLLAAAKARLKHGEFEKMLAEDLRCDRNWAHRLRKVAADDRLTNVARAPLLPPSVSVLYELSQLDDETLDGKFERQEITPKLDRDTVRGWRSGNGTAGDPAQSGQPAGARRENDFYPTPNSIVAEIAARWKPKSRRVWEPCAGDGRIAEALADAGFEVISSDIAWATGGDSGEAGEARDGGTQKGQDFFAAASPPGSGAALCTNPPFDRVRAFIDHAFAIGIEEMCLVLPERIWACAAGRAQFERHRPALWVNLDWREDYLGKGGSPDRALAVAIWTSPCASECRFEVWGRNGSPERSGSARSEGAEDSTEGDDEQNPNGSTGGIVGTTPFDAGSGPGADVDARPRTATSENVEAGDEDSYTTPPSSEGGQIPGADGSLTPRDHSQAKPDDEAEAGPPPKQASGAGQERPARGKEERPARGKEERPARGETINALIRAGYARDTPLPALAAQTGLTENAVKQRAKRMGLGDRQRAWKLGAGKGKAAQ